MLRASVSKSVPAARPSTITDVDTDVPGPAFQLS
jgi:hypothetical protein